MLMRNLVMIVGLLLTPVGGMAQDNNAPAQPDVSKTAPPPIPEVGFVNQIDFGLRGTRFSADTVDNARFQRYQDLRDGATIDRLRFAKETNQYLMKLDADHVGYRDQRFIGSVNNFGKLKASFEWNQIPLFFSQDTRTLYDRSTPGVLTLNDGIQSGIQNKTLTLASALGGALSSTCGRAGTWQAPTWSTVRPATSI